MTTTEPTTRIPTRTVDGRPVPAAGTYAIDASHSHVGFSVRHLMVAKTKGRFGEVAGTITIAEDPAESSVEVEIATGSVDTRDAGRDTHLRSADFFDVDAFPTMRFRSTRVTPAAAGTWLVDGELSIKDVTLPVPLTVTFEGGNVDPWGGARIGFEARAEVDRDAFGLSWNQALEAGGVLVGRSVKVDLEIEAVAE